MGWLDEGGSGAKCDAAKILDSDGMGALMDMLEAGALISMGKTSDGGALGVTVTVDGTWRREYFRDGEALTSWAEGGRDDVIAACEARAASSARSPRQRSRRTG